MSMTRGRGSVLVLKKGRLIYKPIKANKGTIKCNRLKRDTIEAEKLSLFR